MNDITIHDAVRAVSKQMAEREERAQKVFSFSEYLKIMREKPYLVFRTAPEILRDLVREKLVKKSETNPDDPEAIGYTGYDCSELLEKGHSQPFFASVMFSHVLAEEIEALAKNSRQNRIYVFEGPHGCGKSTFLKNLLAQYQEYINENPMFEVFWKIEKENFEFLKSKACSFDHNNLDKEKRSDFMGNCLEIPCPGHDRPILVIPKKFRADFLNNILTDKEWKRKIFEEKSHDWVLNREACPVCQSLFSTLYNRFGRDMEKVLEVLQVRYYLFNRTMGQGIKVLRSGDESSGKNIVTNEMLQKRITNFFGDSHLVRYRFSKQAQANNGLMVLEDIKNFNVDRFMGCHNLVSEGAQSVGEDVEEEINCLFIALMNPEDRGKIQDTASLKDRITFVNIDYPTDVETEVEIYKSVFGKDVGKNFLPKILRYFATVVVASRLPKKASSDTFLKEFISGDEFGSHYADYCDKDGLVFLMEISRGNLPDWLVEKHRVGFKARVRRKILDVIKEKSGKSGYSARQSISFLESFISYHSRVEKHLVGIKDVLSFFKKFFSKVGKNDVPEHFLEHILRIYNREVTDEMKEALYYYNAERIGKDIKQYLFAINFETGVKKRCVYTGEEIEMSDDFLKNIERHILGKVPDSQLHDFRKHTQKEYITKTLTQEMRNNRKNIEETELYGKLCEAYISKLKTGALDPWIESDNFRRAIYDYGLPQFDSYGERIREHVSLMMKNLTGEKFGYTPEGAKKIAVYVLDLYRKKK